MVIKAPCAISTYYKYVCETWKGRDPTKYKHPVFWGHVMSWFGQRNTIFTERISVHFTCFTKPFKAYPRMIIFWSCIIDSSFKSIKDWWQTLYLNKSTIPPFLYKFCLLSNWSSLNPGQQRHRQKLWDARLFRLCPTERNYEYSDPDTFTYTD